MICPDVAVHRFTNAYGEQKEIELSSRTPIAARTLTKPPHCTVIAPPMRKTLLALAVIAAFVVAWSAWPFFGLYDLARAAQSGDVARIEQRVDFPALGRSLSGQIVATYARLTGVPVDRSSLVAGLASAVADPLIARMLTRAAVAELLQRGWPSEVLGAPPPQFQAPDWNSLGNVWQIYTNAEYGIGEFRLRIPATAPRERQYRVQLGLRGWSWKLTGLDLPTELLERLARELIKQHSKDPLPALVPGLRR